MNNKADEATITSSTVHCFSPRDRILLNGELMIVRHVSNTTLTVRKARWYDYLWRYIVSKYRAMVRLIRRGECGS